MPSLTRKTPSAKSGKKTGGKPGGKPPTVPEPGVKDSDQINLTDEEARIMKLSGGGFWQCYNPQAGFDVATMLVVQTDTRA